jgi:hypothetical protein
MRGQITPLPATRIAMLSDRQEVLVRTVVGGNKTGVPLIGFDGQKLVPVPCSDDIGIYYFIPMLVKAARLSLADAVDLFLVGIVLFSALSGAVGLMLVCRTAFGRIIAISAVVLLSSLSLKIGDVYLVQSSVVLAFVPWVLFFGRKAYHHWSIIAFVFFSSAALASASLIRSHAGTPVLILMAWVFAFQLRCNRHFKLSLTLAAIMGCLLPLYYSRRVLDARDTYLQRQAYGSATATRQHVFWHVIYLGLGYLSNDVVPGYRDEIAAAKVREKAPQIVYTSPEYEEYLRHEVIHIIVQHPLLVIETLAAKLGVVAGWLLICANVGLVAAYYYPKHWAIEAGFWSAIGFQALVGILAIPARAYLLGFIAVAVVYGTISIDVGLKNGLILAFSRSVRSRWVRT